ncbi:hypothetical protein F511_11658 [Dorcoceras hygrometricum]|uniref:Uncharacterized protein n=1 Tax=Dorcoceras hygrometricum TaxID=472368 RepID=A0A2Z7ALX1_9LAMI|nr:hypothetical protein F511_11658 [Dorcoceras hygrometricum]
MIKEEQIREALDEKNRAKLVKGQTRSEKRKPDQGSWLSWILERDGFIVDNVEYEEEEEMWRQESVILNSCRWRKITIVKEETRWEGNQLGNKLRAQ